LKNLQEISTHAVLLFRPIHMRDLEKADLLNSCSIYLFQWEVIWEQDSNAYLRECLANHKIAKESIHNIRSCKPIRLKRFADALVPSRIVPIHTFMPEKYLEIYNNVELHADGQYWEV